MVGKNPLSVWNPAIFLSVVIIAMSFLIQVGNAEQADEIDDITSQDYSSEDYLELFDLVVNPVASVRIDAFNEIVDIGSPIVPIMFEEEYISNNIGVYRTYILRAIGEDAVDPLIEILKLNKSHICDRSYSSGVHKVLRDAIYGLKAIGPPAIDSASILEQMLVDPNMCDVIKSIICRALESIQPHDSNIVPILLDVINKDFSSPEKYAYICEAMFTLAAVASPEDTAVINTVLMYLDNYEYEGQKIAASYCLYKLGYNPSEMIDYIISVATDSTKSYDTNYAFKALARINNDISHSALSEIISDYDDFNAAGALIELQDAVPTKEIIEIILIGINAQDLGINSTALGTLRWHVSSASTALPDLLEMQSRIQNESVQSKATENILTVLNEIILIIQSDPIN
jgi:hypothetical protein